MSTNKFHIHVENSEEQLENSKNSRKSFAVLQKKANNENLIGRRIPAYISKERLAKKTDINEFNTPDNKRKKTATSTQSSQTTPSLEANTSSKVVTIEDLTSDVPSEKYWEVLAEKRRLALDESLTENKELYDRIQLLEEELDESRKVCAETQSLVEVMTEMLEENQSDDQPAKEEEPEESNEEETTEPEAETSTDV